MFVKVNAVKKAFKFAGQRVPKGFVDALNTVVSALVDSAKGGERKITQETLVAVCTRNPVLGKHVSKAITILEQEGNLDKGLLMPTAQKIANEEKVG